MRVMVMVKATKNSEAGILPGDPRAPEGFDQLFEKMGQFNEELVKAGVMLAGDGLKPSSHGKRVRFTGSGGTKIVIDGPFAETKELVAGYWIWQVKSIEEAVEWAQRCPRSHAWRGVGAGDSPVLRGRRTAPPGSWARWRPIGRPRTEEMGCIFAADSGGRAGATAPARRAGELDTRHLGSGL